MKRRNATRSALFTSIISLLLCVSMLVGTTFAWFTDSVESGVNVINAGNLDVELYHGKEEATEKVDNSDKLFTDLNGNLIELWEPGVVAYTNLKVANEGTLALTYQMTLNFTNMNYVEENGARYTLADVLKVAVVEGGFTGDRAAAHALDYNHTLSSFGLEGVLEAEETSKTYGIVIYWMPNDNAYDNIFNLNNDKTSSDEQPMHVDLGVSLFATQEMYEEDSFGDDYDDIAKLEMPEIRAEAATTNAFLEALAAGKTAVLTADLTLDQDAVIPEGVTSGIVLNGNTLTLSGENNIIVEGNLIVAKGKVESEGLAFWARTNSNLVIEEDAVVKAGPYGIYAYGEPAKITVNGTINADYAIGVMGGTTDVTINENAVLSPMMVSTGTMNVTYYGTEKPAVQTETLAGAVVNYYNIREVETNDELNTAIDEFADEIILPAGEFTADIYDTDSRDSLIIRGQGAETKLAFSNLQVRASQFDKSLTIDNCTIEHMATKSWGHLVYGSSDAAGVYTISNCIFNGEGTQGIYINENVDGATYNIENCVFNGDFGSEGAITIQNNNAVFTVNVTGCEFNNIPETSHDIYVAPVSNVTGGNWILNVNGSKVIATSAQLVDAINNGATEIELAPGNYTWPTSFNGSGVNSLQGKTLTIKGTRNAVIDTSAINMNDQYVTGANLTFEGVTLNFGTVNYMGFANTASLTYKDCAVNGLQFVCGNGTVEFVDCDLNSNGAEHSLWTWGISNISFTGCDFTYADRAINCYAEYGQTNATFTGCTFTKVEGADTTGAIETNSSTMTALNLTINNCSVNEGNLWWVSTWDSKNGANTCAIVDGKVASSAAMIAAIKNGATEVELAPGNYTMPIGSNVNLSGKTLTIKGTKDTVIDVSKVDERDQYVTGATLKFEGVTLNFGTALYMGFANCNSLTYEDCVINGVQHLYGPEINFVKCELNVSGDHYMVRTWGGKNVNFSGCTFNCDGKAILVYNQSCNLTVENCVFNDNGTISGKAAIEVCNGDNGDNCVTHNVVIKKTTVNGFDVNPNGISTNSTLWANKNSLDDAHLNVTIDGVVVY